MLHLSTTVNARPSTCAPVHRAGAGFVSGAGCGLRLRSNSQAAGAAGATAQVGAATAATAQVGARRSTGLRNPRTVPLKGLDEIAMRYKQRSLQETYGRDDTIIVSKDTPGGEGGLLLQLLNLLDRRQYKQVRMVVYDMDSNFTVLSALAQLQVDMMGSGNAMGVSLQPILHRKSAVAGFTTDFKETPALFFVKLVLMASMKDYMQATKDAMSTDAESKAFNNRANVSIVSRNTIFGALSTRIQESMLRGDEGHTLRAAGRPAVLVAMKAIIHARLELENKKDIMVVVEKIQESVPSIKYGRPATNAQPSGDPLTATPLDDSSVEAVNEEHQETQETGGFDSKVLELPSAPIPTDGSTSDVFLFHLLPVARAPAAMDQKREGAKAPSISRPIKVILAPAAAHTHAAKDQKRDCAEAPSGTPSISRPAKSNSPEMVTVPAAEWQMLQDQLATLTRQHSEVVQLLTTVLQGQSDKQDS